MRKFKCTVSYDGTNFFGSQIQPSKRTIQYEIEKVLTRIHKGKETKIVISGRTDTGVHARAQVFHFETDLNIPVENWQRALNAQLPDDICVEKMELVSSDFHARYTAIEKEYRYFVLNRRERDVFQRNYTHFDRSKLNVAAMKKACTFLEGTHDFTPFCSVRSTVRGSKVRTLYEVNCHQEDDMITFILRGNGFLYNMIRIIIGALLDVGKGKLAPDDIGKILNENRSFARKTLPPQGLFLWEVTYKNE